MAASVEREVLFAGWWIILGVASSIGLGSGLHTFVLYLGPHIAYAAFVAQDCGSVDFDTRLAQDAWECSDGPGVTFWQIVAKVAPESFLWGLGTAIGELPPYFVARAARLAGQRLEELDAEASEPGMMGNVKRWVLASMEWAGFTGVLLMAAIPNPLFDLAGLTCGHLLFPFWKFFGATMIGKAAIKSQIQVVSVVAITSPKVVDFITKLAGGVYAPAADAIRAAIAKQKAKFHHHAAGIAAAAGAGAGSGSGLGAGAGAGAGAGSGAVAAAGGLSIGVLWEWFIKIFIGLFVISFVNSLACDRLIEEKEAEITAIMEEVDAEEGDIDVTEG
jgi:hypothetical protein